VRRARAATPWLSPEGGEDEKLPLDLPSCYHTCAEALDASPTQTIRSPYAIRSFASAGPGKPVGTGLTQAQSATCTSLRLLRRQHDGEGTAGPQGALNPQSPVVLLDDCLFMGLSRPGGAGGNIQAIALRCKLRRAGRACASGRDSLAVPSICPRPAVSGCPIPRSGVEYRPVAAVPHGPVGGAAKHAGAGR